MSTPLTHRDGTLTSLTQLFGQNLNGTQVKAIEIPIFQRDYAQGRQSEQARHVRERFISDLCAALDDGTGINLDFVFGDVVDGTLYPLDGQQRLTTLFLLHCYLAWRLPNSTTTSQPWHAFHYATRPGARAFCKFLTQCSPVMTEVKVSEWLCDQAIYLPTWKHDPTIQGMLVVLDTLHQHFRGQCPEMLSAAWQRLTDPENPAIRFLLLPVAAKQQDNTLYVKMNSRGRPLTEFENFKAELEALLHKNAKIGHEAVKAFSLKIDTDWADLFWQYRGHNNLIDEECMRYFRFLFEVLAWKRGLPVQTGHSDLHALTKLSEALLGSTVQNASDDFCWIVNALDVWLEKEADGVHKPKAVGTLFSKLFTRNAQNTTTQLRIFNFPEVGEPPVGVNMLHACCRRYGTRHWSLAHTVLLYGVLQGEMHVTPESDLHPRLRMLRNLIEASRNEIRADATRNNMGALLKEVGTIITTGQLTNVKTFNQVQVGNEQAKQALVNAHPALKNALYQLEDHELLRGGLTAFDLHPAQPSGTFSNRAAKFPELFNHPYQLVSGALLAMGHKGRWSQRRSGHRLIYLGAPQQKGLWEDHWRIRSNETIHPSSPALMKLLDDMAAGTSLQAVIDTFLDDPRTAKDWRYYITKYEVMRGERLEFAGSYVVSPGSGYSICMTKSDTCDNRSNHHDAYLLALAEAAKIPLDRIGNEGWPRCFPGYETEERHLKLRNSGIQIRCVDAGWQFSDMPSNNQQRQTFVDIAEGYNHYQNQCLLYAVPQTNNIDIEDRIELGSQLLQKLINAGL